jgi:hypothetical protein
MQHQRLNFKLSTLKGSLSVSFHSQSIFTISWELVADAQFQEELEAGDSI